MPEDTQLDSIDQMLYAIEYATSDDLHLLRVVARTLAAEVRRLQEQFDSLFDTSEAEQSKGKK